MKFKAYKDGDLKGCYDVSWKIDGLSVTIIDGIPFSKGDKVFSNLEDFVTVNGLEKGVYEFFRTSWQESVGLVKNSARSSEIQLSDFYMLSPLLDKRLFITTVIDPTAEYLKTKLEEAVKTGYEGLILGCRDTGIRTKVKTSYTMDLRCTGFEEGVGKLNKGMVGVLLFELDGRPIRVSSGITKVDRITWFIDPTLIGSIFEIKYINMTPDKSLRHPSIVVRRRFDKDNESYE